MVKTPPANARDPGSVPGSGRSPGVGIGYPHQYSWASLMAQRVKNLPAMWETWIQSLGWKDPPGKEMATDPSIHVYPVSSIYGTLSFEEVSYCG